LKRIKNRWKDEKRFWTRLVDKHLQHFFLFEWKDVPVSMRRDAEVARSYVPRHCRTLACLAEVLADAPSALTDLEEEDLIDIAMGILWSEEYDKSDWVPLLTLLPAGWRSNHPLCVEMFEEQSYVYQHLPQDFQRDREIVEATLCGATAACFCEVISTDIQAMFPELIAQWLRCNACEVRPDFFRRRDLQFAPELWRNRAFVMAFTETGGSKFCDRFGFDYNVYREDRTVLLAVGKISVQRFAKICPAMYRRDKEFMLEAIGVSASLLKAVHHSLLDDFGFLSAAIATNKETISLMDSNLVTKKHVSPPNFVFISPPPTQDEREKRGMFKLTALARHVRDKLHSHKGFLQLLRGMGTGQKVKHDSPLTLLNQGSETSDAYKRRIAEFLGAPLGAELKRQRELLLELTRWGY
jgi:hypothetical protein